MCKNYAKCFVVQNKHINFVVYVLRNEYMDKINKTEKGLRYCYKYPHPSVTTDCVIFGFDGTKLRVLLV